MDNDIEDRITYKVVMNHEEQYSIWAVDRENALGWTDVGVSGTKKECLDHIEVVWTDMTPLSVRKHMEEFRNKSKAAPPALPSAQESKPASKRKKA